MADEQENMISNKLWLSVSQSAKLCGVEQKTIRRAIKAKQITYVVQHDRYTIETGSLIIWAHQSAKIKNKLQRDGIGKFVQAWKDEYTKLSTEKTSQ